MPVAFTCPKCSRAMRVPDTALGKKVKCPGCQEMSTVTAEGGAPPGAKAASGTPAAPAQAAPAQAAAGQNFEQACPKCQKKMKLPAAAAGKTVKCPGCQTAFKAGGARPAAGVATPAAVRTASPVGAAASSADPFGGLGGLSFDDGLISERDFDVSRVRSVPRPAAPEEINVGDGPALPRPHSIYKKPAIFTMVAGALNLIFSIVLIVLAVNAIRSDVTSDGVAIVWAIIIFIICAIEAVRIFLGGFAVLKVEERSRVFVAIGELMFAPLGGLFLASNKWSWLGSFLVGGIFAGFCWPVGIWLFKLVGGEQGKIDFGDMSKDDLEEQARQLTRRAAGLGGGGH